MSTKRPWAVRVVGYLLAAQAMGLLALGYELAEGWWRGVYGLLGLVAAVAAIGFLFSWGSSRLLGISAQGGSLLVALGLYFTLEAPWYAYVMMAYGIVMVLYLNTAGVVQAFRPRETQSWGGVAR